MSGLRIMTTRLELISGISLMLAADMADKRGLSEMLGCDIPDMWPPETWKDALEEFMVRLDRHPGLAGWLSWYWVLTDGDSRVLIGSGGFTGAPFNGEVMIGYSVLDPFQRQGYGSEAVNALVNWAFAHPSVLRIVAETLHENKASISLLEKCGFEYSGKGFEKGTIRFLLPREKWLLSRK
jgi:ribosomal-protein-alanine N-acetyltransferase